MLTTTRTSILLTFLLAGHLCLASTHTFQELLDVIEEKRVVLSEHKFFKFLAAESIPATKRMQFVPYFGYFAIAGADLLDTWFRIPNPRTELERRVNIFVEEDNFHYNLFISDMEDVLGYTSDRFGSYGAVMRHLFGDDSKAVRMLVYKWGAVPTMSEDPLVTLASFEAVEACLKYLFENAKEHVFDGQNGLPDLKYFGQTHIDFEKNHTLTSWFKEDDVPFRPLATHELSEESKQVSLKVVDELFYWFDKVYDSLYNLCMAEDSIYPEKYIVNDFPPMNAFPVHHPNRLLFESHGLKDEL